MTAVLPAPAASRPARTTQVVRAIARPEAVRLLRRPVLWVGVALSSLAAYAMFHSPDDWSGARYMSAPIMLGPLRANKRGTAAVVVRLAIFEIVS